MSSVVLCIGGKADGARLQLPFYLSHGRVFEVQQHDPVPISSYAPAREAGTVPFERLLYRAVRFDCKGEVRFVAVPETATDQYALRRLIEGYRTV
jgi:hypothetical protein